MIRILLIIAIISGGLLATYMYSLKRASSDFDDLATLFNESQVGEITDTHEVQVEVEETEKSIAFEELYERNSDMVGWLSIPGTKVNYPVMHTPEDPDYYLYKNFDKEHSRSGVPFVDGKASLGPDSDNILIHGHHMKDGSMFAQLLNYQEKDFLEKHPTIELYTFAAKQTYDIIGVFPAKIHSGNEAFDYHNFIKAKDQEEFDKYVGQVKKYSLFETGVSAKYGDQLLTLSTCAYHTKNGRFIVVAKSSRVNSLI